MVMTVVLAEKRTPVWDPVAATEARREADEIIRRHDDLSETYERVKNWSSMRDFRVRSPDPETGEAAFISMPEYLMHLTWQAQEAEERCKHYGGQIAVDALATHVPYAGELPPRPEPRLAPVDYNRPA